MNAVAFFDLNNGLLSDRVENEKRGKKKNASNGPLGTVQVV